jgi:hypothetical protein
MSGAVGMSTPPTVGASPGSAPEKGAGFCGASKLRPGSVKVGAVPRLPSEDDLKLGLKLNEGLLKLRVGALGESGLSKPAKSALGIV